MNKMDDPKVKEAIRLLKAKGITLKQIEDVYKYYERLYAKANTSPTRTL